MYFSLIADKMEFVVTFINFYVYTNMPIYLGAIESSQFIRPFYCASK